MPGYAITDSDGFELTDADGYALDESCSEGCAVCGGECLLFARLIPCTADAKDPACAIPPGQGELFICINLVCATPPGVSWWRPNPIGAIRPMVIFYQALCWAWDEQPPILRELVPEGARVIDTGTVACVPDCNDPVCGFEFQYAEATPCDPGYPPRPWPLFCPAGLPFDCRVLNPHHHVGGLPAQWNNCFEFDRNAPTQAYPPGTPVLTLPPGGVYPPKTCCTCDPGCAQYTTPPLPSRWPGIPDYPGCCCLDISGATITVSGNSYVEGWTLLSIFPDVYYLSGTETREWSGVKTGVGLPPGLITLTITLRFYNPAGELTGTGTQTQQFPLFVTCPVPAAFTNLTGLVLGPGPSFAHLNPWGSGYELRSCERYMTGGSWNFPTVPPPDVGVPYLGRVSWRHSERLTGMTAQGGCRNDNCGPAVSFRPAGPGRPIDAILFPQGGGGGGGGGLLAVAGGEGCGGCGDQQGW